MITEYICLAILCCWLLFYVYVKIAYPFWSHMPVMHTYDWYRRLLFSNPFIIQAKEPIKTKFTYKYLIDTQEIVDITDSELLVFTEFLQSHQYDSEQLLHLLSQSLLLLIFEGANKSYISKLETKSFQINWNKKIEENNTSKIEEISKIEGLIGSYEVLIYFLNYPTASFSEVSFIDFVCLDRKITDKNYLYSLLQTHDYNVRRDHPGTVFLYKNKNNLCNGIVPLLSYESYLFPLNKIKLPSIDMKIQCQRIKDDNFTLLSDFLYNISRGNCNEHLELVSFPNLSQIKNRLQKEYYIGFVVRRQEELVGCFLFKDLYQHIENEGNVLECIASFSNLIENKEETMFFWFLQCLHTIQNELKKKFAFLMLNTIGHNQFLLDKWRWKYQEITSHQNGYYLINGGTSCMPFPKESCFLVL